MNNNLRFVIIFLLALSLLSCNLIHKFSNSNNQPGIEAVFTPTKIPAVIGTPKPTIARSADWLNYQNSDFGIIFSYPATWKLVVADDSKAVNLYPPESDEELASPMIHFEVVDTKYSNSKTIVQTDNSIEEIEIAGEIGKYYTDSEFSQPEQSCYIELPSKDKEKTFFFVATIGPSVDLSNQLLEIVKTFQFISQ
jgi:hypothetical protein